MNGQVFGTFPKTDGGKIFFFLAKTQNKAEVRSCEDKEIIIIIIICSMVAFEDNNSPPQLRR